jgi:hypothetical protein
MQITGQIGPTGPVTSGSPATPIRQGNYGDITVSALNGRYYEQGIRGNAYTVANTAATTVTAVATASYTGLILGNPTGSGKNFVLLEAIFASAAAPTGVGALILGNLAYAVPTTLITPTPTLIGTGTTSAAKTGSANTALGTATFLRPLLGIGFSSGADMNSFQYKDDIGGLIVIPPGIQVVFNTVTTTLSGICSFTWVELNANIL